jgi:hypothetical protein
MHRFGSTRGRAVLAASVTSLALALGASPSSAVTLGQLAPPVSPADSCADGPFDVLQPSVTSGNGYAVPSTGGVTNWTVTSWSTRNRAVVGDTMGLKMFRKVGDPEVYKVVGHEAPRSLASGINTFSANLQVQAGDVLGAHSGGGDCAFDVPGQSILFVTGADLPDGGQAQFESDVPFRLNETAEITPTGDFTLGKPKSKPNGTAKLTVTVPNPGELSVSGGGAAKSSPSASAAKQVAAAGTVTLKIKAKGRKKRKLARKGKVTVNPKIIFTPTGGIPTSQFRKIKLRTR